MWRQKLMRTVAAVGCGRGVDVLPVGGEEALCGVVMNG